ncbi:hypothetical protein GCM10011609_04330 [Lentzea pudingi]|uniref:GDSL-like Lipase/Acylhydrolase n=1 Tax=Lentzea pudingi TaxID=1789439 RepID=A0ABQ2HBB5_9PSEU|nr:hypothetical protein [Lentzea pudingi]GGM71731.1 hypothetical protein GCM10011609_04330 [Lentzea pudingi]
MKTIPAEVAAYVQQNEPRTPVFDCTAGVARPTPGGTELRHRLVVIGDSLSHGFQSGSIFNTELSYPAIIAHELGWSGHFRHPRYPFRGGLPFNLEEVMRRAERRFGLEISGWRESMQAAADVWRFIDDVEDYWERGDGSIRPADPWINHCLAVYGWDLRDALELTSDLCWDSLEPVNDNPFKPWVQNASERAALRVYPSGEHSHRTFFDAAKALNADGGIETLVVFLGANNALKVVTRLKVEWSEDPGYATRGKKDKYTVWQPEHFRAELAEIEANVEAIGARRVIWCTVPHVTVAPIARGVNQKKGTPYFEYYTRPWIPDGDFNQHTDDCITGAEAHAVDAAIDLYNEAITATVRKGRENHDWYLLDTAGLMDRLAHRRYIVDLEARPSWWEPYELPEALAKLAPRIDSRFLTADGTGGRRTGGLFSLDGVHPTTVGYGLIAQELIKIMEQAGVVFRSASGEKREGPIKVNFERLIEADTLVKSPPQNIGFALDSLGWLDEMLDWAKLATGGGWR